MNSVSRGKALVLCSRIRGTDRWMGTKQRIDPGKIEPDDAVTLTTWDGKPAGMVNREQRFRPLRIIEQIRREVLLTAIGQNRDDRAFAHHFGHLGRREDRCAGTDPHK